MVPPAVILTARGLVPPAVRISARGLVPPAVRITARGLVPPAIRITARGLVPPEVSISARGLVPPEVRITARGSRRMARTFLFRKSGLCPFYLRDSLSAHLCLQPQSSLCSADFFPLPGGLAQFAAGKTLRQRRKCADYPVLVFLLKEKYIHKLFVLKIDWEKLLFKNRYFLSLSDLPHIFLNFGKNEFKKRQMRDKK